MGRSLIASQEGPTQWEDPLSPFRKQLTAPGSRVMICPEHPGDNTAPERKE